MDLVSNGLSPFSMFLLFYHSFYMMVARSICSQSLCSYWEPPEVCVGLGSQHAEKPVKYGYSMSAKVNHSGGKKHLS